MKNNVIKSFSYSNTEILKNINSLFLDNKGFELDPTYSKGNFYKNFPKPKYKSDINPHFKDVIQADFTDLPFENNFINSSGLPSWPDCDVERVGF